MKQKDRKLLRRNLLLLAFYLFVFTLFFHFSFGELTTGLLVNYNLSSSDETFGVFTVNTNSVTYEDDGFLGNSLYCDASGNGEYFDITNLALGTTNFSMNIWIDYVNSAGHNYFELASELDDDSYSMPITWRYTTSTTPDQLQVILGNGASQTQVIGYDRDITTNWTMFTVIVHGIETLAYLNGEFIGGSNTSVTKTDSSKPITLCNWWYNSGTHTSQSSATHYTDEFSVWNRKLTDNEILALYNEGSGCIYQDYDEECGFTEEPPTDTTPPVINSVLQIPENATVLNIAVEELNIIANITDETLLNITNINITMTLNNTAIYINGTLQSVNKTKIYANYTNDLFNFVFDENEILGSSYPLSHEIFENTKHKNLTLTGLNTWVKMTFYNISNKVRQTFNEIYDTNSTSTSCLSDYWYCNSSYTNGNPVSNNNCALFFSASNNRAYNHSHSDNSKHHIIPMGIDTTTGTLNDIYVTPTSYILKRGTTCGDLVFYVPNISRTTQSQYTNSNGNTWSSISGTIDSHIHQININSSINYKICADDQLFNTVCSETYTDFIDFPILKPTSVNILSPEEEGVYNTTIIIEHTESISTNGYDITGYKIEYAVYGTDTYYLISANNYPNLNYTWDISSLLNQDYKLRVTVTDEINLTSISEVPTFTIQNPLTAQIQLLTDINSNVALIEGGIKMLGYIILMIVSIWLIIFNKNIVLDLFNSIIDIILMLLFNSADSPLLMYLSLAIFILSGVKIYSANEQD